MSIRRRRREREGGVGGGGNGERDGVVKLKENEKEKRRRMRRRKSRRRRRGIVFTQLPPSSLLSLIYPDSFTFSLSFSLPLLFLTFPFP